MSNNSERTLLGRVNLKYGDEVIPDVAVFLFEVEREFKGTVTKKVYATTQLIDSHNIPANTIRLYEGYLKEGKQKLDFEKNIKPLFEGESIILDCKSKKEGKPYRVKVSFDATETPVINGKALPCQGVLNREFVTDSKSGDFE